ADKSIFRFFEKDDYTCVGDDATKLSEIYFNSDSVLKTHEDLKYSTFNKNMFEQIVKYLLTDQHHIIELYQFKNASWCLKGKASPGNFGVFEDLMS
ncbi:MAG: MutS-like protein, partial [Marteilia pararefringens]